jgi:hypothetical protein
MKDFLGQELAVDDEVIVIMRHDRNCGGDFSRGKITKITAACVFFNGGDYTGRDIRERKTFPEKVVKITKLKRTEAMANATEITAEEVAEIEHTAEVLSTVVPPADLPSSEEVMDAIIGGWEDC